METLQYGPTGSHTLENADHQNAIAILPPESHTQPYSIMIWEYRRDCSTVARAWIPPGIKWRLIAWLILGVSDFADPAAQARPPER
jgi:hypothetical protein